MLNTKAINKKRAVVAARFCYRYLRLSLPEAVEVAVGVSGDEGVGLGEREGDLRLACEGLSLPALLGFDCDPADEVLGKHGVKGRANDDLDRAVFILCDNGKVLFGSCLGGVGNELGHLLATAHNRNALVFYVCDDIATMFTLEKSHNLILPLSKLI